MLDTKQARVSKPDSLKSHKKPSSSRKPQHKSSPSLQKALDTHDPIPASQPATKANRKSSQTTETVPSPLKDTAPIGLLLRPLASSVPSIRRNGITTLFTHLSDPNSALSTPTHFAQIWRALYVALYMHDSKSAISVQNLARQLASTLRIFYERDLAGLSDGNEPADVDESSFGMSTRWSTAFWDEVTREWNGIDQWRMNKVLMLVRFWIVESVAITCELAGLKDNTDEDDKEDNAVNLRKTNPDAYKSFLAEITALPLEPSRKMPHGLRMHVLDVWKDQLETLSAEEGAEAVVGLLLQPVKEIAVFRSGADGEHNQPKNVRTRAKEVLSASKEQRAGNDDREAQ